MRTITAIIGFLIFSVFFMFLIWEESSLDIPSNITIVKKCDNCQEKILSNATIVKRIIDGDTIELQSGEKVRLICIDTPERGKPFFAEATNYTRSLVQGKEVYLEKDVSDKDRYGRLLRYVYFYEEGRQVSLNRELVANGYAMVYRYPPDINHCNEYAEAAKYAAENNVGLWANS